MSVQLKPGARIYSTVDAGEFITVKAPADPVDVTIGGAAVGLAPADGSAGEPAVGHDGGAAIGRRYTDADGTLELLCTKAGVGVPALGGVVLELKGAKPLPASD